MFKRLMCSSCTVASGFWCCVSAVFRSLLLCSGHPLTHGLCASLCSHILRICLRCLGALLFHRAPGVRTRALPFEMSATSSVATPTKRSATPVAQTTLSKPSPIAKVKKSQTKRSAKPFVQTAPPKPSPISNVTTSSATKSQAWSPSKAKPSTKLQSATITIAVADVRPSGKRGGTDHDLDPITDLRTRPKISCKRNPSTCCGPWCRKRLERDDGSECRFCGRFTCAECAADDAWCCVALFKACLL